MLQFIVNNLGNIAVSAILLFVVGGVIYYMVKESKKLKKGFSYFTENDNMERCMCCDLSFPKTQMKLYHNNFLCKDCLSFF